jgi:hypothetical protein
MDSTRVSNLVTSGCLLFLALTRGTFSAIDVVHGNYSHLVVLVICVPLAIFASVQYARG